MRAATFFALAVFAYVSSSAVDVATTSGDALAAFTDLAGATICITAALELGTLSADTRRAAWAVVGGSTSLDTEGTTADFAKLAFFVFFAGGALCHTLVVFAGLAVATVCVTTTACFAGSRGAADLA